MPQISKILDCAWNDKQKDMFYLVAWQGQKTKSWVPTSQVETFPKKI